MTSSHRIIAVGIAIAAAVLSFVAGVYPVELVGSWLGSRLDAATSDANTWGKRSGAAESRGAAGAPQRGPQ
jgi:hypothetical protein